MAKTEIRSLSLADMKDKHIGSEGTADRTLFEYDLRMDVHGRINKQARQHRSRPMR